MIGSQLIRLAKGSVIYGLGSVVQRFLTLLLLPFFTQVLSPKDYGIVALVGLVTIGVSGLFNLGTTNSMGILYFERDDSGDRHTVIWSTVTLLVFNCLILGSLLIYCAPFISLLVFETTEHTYFLRISFLTTLIVTVLEPFYAYLRYEEQAKEFVFFSISSGVVAAVMSVVLVLGFEWGVTGLLLSALFSQVIMVVIVLLAVARHMSFGVETSIFLPLVRIGFPSIFGILALLVIDYADRQMLQRMIDLGAVGIYSIGYNLALVMLIVVSAFGMAWPPFFMSYIKDQETAKVLFGKVLNYYLIAFGLLTVVFFIAAKPLVTLIDEKFSEAYKVIGLVAGAYMLKGAYLILLPGIVFARKLYWQSTIEWIAAGANIGLNFLLIPRFGLVGAAVATLVSYLTLVFLAWIIGRRYLAIAFDWQRIFIITSGVFITSAWVYWASINASPMALAFNAFGAAATLLLTVSTLGLDRRERSAVVITTRKFLKR